MNQSKLRRLRDRTSGPATLISEGCKITGALEGNGDFLINGEIVGDCNLAGSVTIAQNGVWKGTVCASTIIVAGTIEGDIESNGRVEITATARITGTVTAQAIAVAEGAIVQGMMKTTGQSAPIGFVEKRKTDNAGQH